MLCSVHQTSTHPGMPMRMLRTWHQRVAQTSALLDWLDTLPPDTPVIFGGDFNEGSDALSLGRVTDRYTHAFTAAGRGDPITFRGMGGLQIDHVYCSDHFEVVDCFVDPARVSDHRMVVAKLRLRKAADE
jgi:endonuclease/exonuclease/phosphatase (EEP) superfamily protein YafD